MSTNPGDWTGLSAKSLKDRRLDGQPKPARRLLLSRLARLRLWAGSPVGVPVLDCGDRDGQLDPGRASLGCSLNDSARAARLYAILGGRAWRSLRPRSAPRIAVAPSRLCRRPHARRRHAARPRRAVLSCGVRHPGRADDPLLVLSADDRPATSSSSAALANYVRLASVDLYRTVVMTTLRISLWTTFIAMLLAYPLALVMVRGNALRRPRAAPSSCSRRC